MNCGCVSKLPLLEYIRTLITDTAALIISGNGKKATAMSELERLKKELCPDGVEFKPLGEVCEFKRGDAITRQQTVPGEIPVIAGGQTPSYYHNKANRPGGTIAVSGSGAYAGFVSYWAIPIFLSDAFSVNPDVSRLSVKYVYYFLKNIQEQIYDVKRGGGVPHVYGSSIRHFLTPLPPLPVQREIVRILDKFAELIDILEQELVLRKKQYEYYRNRLLSFGGDVPAVTLGEVCGLFKGKQLNKERLLKTGEYPAYNGGVSYSGFTGSYNVDENTTIISQGGASAGFVQFVECKFWANAHCYYLKPNVEVIDNKYVFYFVKNNQAALMDFKYGAGIPALSSDKITNLSIPLPSLPVQRETVRILDKFTELIDVRGKELVLRKKQYEYYRDKLLVFKQLS